ncbi:embryonic protein UVS.2-like [Bombina bombina]|uniref:embryonic protein UVS.2-like n=1 Tax=Bombina bombina TaxID=8345 RepID=UPI00235ADFBD|nr:embryonic protein UVS.2-like [Bombina bombina]
MSVIKPSSPEEMNIDIIINEANKGSKKMLSFGDIAVPVGRNAKKCDGGDYCRWNKNSSGIVNVPYTLSSNYDYVEVSVILRAMQDFETLTCVRFIPRSEEPDYLKITPSSGCWSYIGKIGGAQDLSLQNCIWKGSVQHELNHALGFHHEQCRSDRDNYIEIVTQNIAPDHLGNFAKKDTNNLEIEYDYSSVMHYSMTAFSKQDGIVTIVPKPNPAVTIGQRYGLSNLDISKINRLYQCGTCSTLLPDSTGTLMSANYPNNYPNNASCVWLIRAPSNKVFIQFSAFDVQASPNCSSDYLKVYDGANRSSPVLLDRSCGTGQLPSFVASSNTMLLELVNDKTIAATGFKASYTTVKCGSTFTNPSGVISTPSYPSNYPPLMDCTWIITAPAGFVISLNMADFQIEQQRTCAYDYVLIFNGPKLTSPEIGRYCGSSTIPSIVSSGNSLLLQFHSDDSVQTKGFIAKYAFGGFDSSNIALLDSVDNLNTHF